MVTSRRLRRIRWWRTSTTTCPSGDSSMMGYHAPRRRMSATLSPHRAQPSVIRMEVVPVIKPSHCIIARSRPSVAVAHQGSPVRAELGHPLLHLVMRELGRIVRLQIQRSSLKTGEKPTRVYDPAPILAVGRLAVGPDGVLGEERDGSWLVDVPHRTHPRTKNEDGAHGVSLGFSSHYALMRDRFGERITPGCAGENIIVETECRMVFADLEHGVALLAPDGRELARLEVLQVANTIRRSEIGRAHV